MSGRYEIELEPEVRAWLDGLPLGQYRHVMFYADLLADNAGTLGEPYSRHLGDGIRELRFYLGRQATRVTYRLAPGRRVVLLTVFVKTRPNEWAEVDRARRAKKLCETEHGAAHETYDR
ncbi:type II toxin-antitoxin system RelE/ParE family toxin [Actinomadura chokoriensis]|uniref:type II toxin-antitoxin system RelE/ParE family toxin n=1 Tax=Actinomadura chokoriensis TaxID=454156 RepID=UPI0031F7D0D0